MKKHLLKLLVFLLALSVSFWVNLSQAAPPGRQCSSLLCDNICWCNGSHYYEEGCCLYCYNYYAGGWLDCCTNACFPK